MDEEVITEAFNDGMYSTNMVHFECSLGIHRDKYLLLIEDGASLDHLLQKYSLDEILSLLD